MKNSWIALFCFCAWTLVAQAEWKIASSERELSPNGAIVHWRTIVQNEKSGDQATLHLAVFATRSATLHVIDQPAPVWRGLAQKMRELECLAGVNGGYFDPDDRPVGLLVSDGRIVSPLRKARLLSGVLWATASRAGITRTSQFSLGKKIKAAVQCGPLLAERAQPVGGLNDARPARRTFAAVDDGGQAALGYCSDATLAELGRILCLTNIAGELKIVRALNLDGGSSSAFWFAGREREVSIPELKTVRDFVVIFPRVSR